MARLGKNQIEFLAGLAAPRRAAVSGDKLLRSLATRGLVKPLGANGDSFFVVTADGLRAVADALDSGAIKETTLDDFKQKGGA